MIVCVCWRVSDRDIERKVRDGCRSFDDLQDELMVATACGTCGDCARKTFECQRETERERAGSRASAAEAAVPPARQAENRRTISIGE